MTWNPVSKFAKLTLRSAILGARCENFAIGRVVRNPPDPCVTPTFPNAGATSAAKGFRSGVASRFQEATFGSVVPLTSAIRVAVQWDVGDVGADVLNPSTGHSTLWQLLSSASQGSATIAVARSFVITLAQREVVTQGRLPNVDHAR